MHILRIPYELVLLFAASLAAATAAAGELPFHVAAGVGRAEVGDIDGFAVDDSATTFNLATGYGPVDWLRIDAAYVNLGTVESVVQIPPGGAANLEASADGFDLVAVARAPLGDALAATAHAGVLWWSSDGSVGDVSRNANGNDLTWGVGVEYLFRPALAATVGWSRYTVDEVDVDVIWLGFMRYFGDVDSSRR